MDTGVDTDDFGNPLHTTDDFGNANYDQRVAVRINALNNLVDTPDRIEVPDDFEVWPKARERAGATSMDTGVDTDDFGNLLNIVDIGMEDPEGKDAIRVVAPGVSGADADAHFSKPENSRYHSKTGRSGLDYWRNNQWQSGPGPGWPFRNYGTGIDVVFNHTLDHNTNLANMNQLKTIQNDDKMVTGYDRKGDILYLNINNWRPTARTFTNGGERMSYDGWITDLGFYGYNNSYKESIIKKLKGSGINSIKFVPRHMPDYK
jgi:hypothetical protein